MEVALPILALGGAYIYSNNSKKESKKRQRIIHCELFRFALSPGRASFPRCASCFRVVAFSRFAHR